MTKFVSLSVAQVVLVVYSENALNERVQSFLDKIEAEVKAEEFARK